MKRICILLIYIAFTFLVVAQSNIRLNNYWGDMHFINPASIYDKYDAPVFRFATPYEFLEII